MLNFLKGHKIYLVKGLVRFRRRQWHPTPVLLPGKSHGRRSLVGYSPRGRKESDTTERLHLHLQDVLRVFLRRRQCTPLQYSCLENPMDGGAWKAAVHGVAKSWAQLCDFTFTFHFHALEKEMATHSSVLAWRIPGMGSLVGCSLWSCTELDTTEAI